MTQQFSNEQIRSAILKTADLFEAKPNLYDFWRTEKPACGTKGCLLGYIGFFIGTTSTNFDGIAREIFGSTQAPFMIKVAEASGIDYVSFRDNASEAVVALRAYADKFYPADPAAHHVDPAFTAWRSQFMREQAAA